MLSEEILRTLPRDSVLFADYSIWAMVRYLQEIEGARSDVELVKLPGEAQQLELIMQYRNRDHLFLADTYRYYALEDIERHFEIVSAGLIYRLVPRNR